MNSRSIHTQFETKDKEDHAKGLLKAYSTYSDNLVVQHATAVELGNWRQTFLLKEYHRLAENGRRFKGPMTIA
jgi:hypothetical protein